jgi:hypothetical protein
MAFGVAAGNRLPETALRRALPVVMIAVGVAVLAADIVSAVRL